MITLNTPAFYCQASDDRQLPRMTSICSCLFIVRLLVVFILGHWMSPFTGSKISVGTDAPTEIKVSNT